MTASGTRARDPRESPATDGRPSGPREALLARAVAWFSEHGIGDTSLRTLAEGIGTSHRMLNYHFGSREGLLTAVVGEVWRRHRHAFEALHDPVDPGATAWAFWTRLADQVDLAALYFEVSAAAMQGHAWAAGPVADQLTEWSTLLSDFFARLGNPPDESQLLARTSLAITRGALELLALDRDRDAADAVMRGFLESLERGPS